MIISLRFSGKYCCTLFVVLKTFSIEILVFSIKILSFFIKILGFSIEILSFFIKILSFSIEILSFFIKIFVFSIKILPFSIEILSISIEKSIFFTVFVVFLMSLSSAGKSFAAMFIGSSLVLIGIAALASAKRGVV